MHAQLKGREVEQRDRAPVARPARTTPAGLGLTESFAMTPAASVSGLIFAHPRSRYFTVGRVGRDQIEDYAVRRELAVSDVERWLRPNLAYDPS
jgi:5-methyltetrahydrofolate--homocysteine methyltransferase